MIGPFTKQYKFLSNFSSSPIRYQGITYPTVEHAFQAAKSPDESIRINISYLDTPAEAKKAGRYLKMSPDAIREWNKKRISIMEEILRIKFQDPDLKDKLMATGSEELVEINTWYDKFWGVCNNQGENNLGKLLMKIREDYKKTYCAYPEGRRPPIEDRFFDPDDNGA